MSSAEARQLRLDTEEIRRNISVYWQPSSDSDSALLVKTATKNTYPSQANAYYYCQVCRPGGVEVEGGSGSINAITGRFIYAYNIGNAVPPVGTPLIALSKNGRYVISYCNGGS